MRYAKLMIVAASALALTACSNYVGSRGKPQVVNANGQASASGAAYAEGVGKGDNSFTSNNKKCFPTADVAGMSQRYFFAFNKYMVSQQYGQSVQQQANYLLTNPNTKIVLKGNTDDIGSPGYNLILGRDRAKAVESMLEQYGVPASQISTVSYGSEKPVALGQSSADRACNRRVDLVYNAR